jgi:DNA-binding IclR family transcriptional regulator
MHEDEAGERPARNGLPVIDRLGDLLDFLEQHPAGATIRDLTRSLELPRSSVYRSLNTLEAHGIVRRSPAGAYTLGPRLLALAAQVVMDPAQA